MYATGVNSDELTAKSQTDSKIQLRKKPSQTRPRSGKFYWDRVTATCIRILVFPGSDSSPEDSTLAAVRTQAVVVKKTKLRGRNPSPQACDKGTAKSQTDSKTLLRKKPFQTSPCDGKFYWDHIWPLYLQYGSDTRYNAFAFDRALNAFIAKFHCHFEMRSLLLWNVFTVCLDCVFLNAFFYLVTIASAKPCSYHTITRDCTGVHAHALTTPTNKLHDSANR